MWSKRQYHCRKTQFLAEKISKNWSIQRKLQCDRKPRSDKISNPVKFPTLKMFSVYAVRYYRFVSLCWFLTLKDKEIVNSESAIWTHLQLNSHMLRWLSVTIIHLLILVFVFSAKCFSSSSVQHWGTMCSNDMPVHMFEKHDYSSSVLVCVFSQFID